MTAYLGISNVSPSLLGIHYMFWKSIPQKDCRDTGYRLRPGHMSDVWRGSGPHTEPELVGIQEAVGLRSPVV